MRSYVTLPALGGLRRFWPAVLVLILGVAATFSMMQRAQTDADQLIQVRFDARIQEIQKAVQTRMTAYEQILRGGSSLFATLGTVSREQWAVYVENLEIGANYPGIQGIGYAAYVPGSEKDAFIKNIRAQGLPDYDIRPPGERPEFSPVTYLEPANARNLKARGFDMWSEPTRREAMMQARDSGQVTITGKLKLASEPNQSPVFGFLMYIPLFQKGLPTDTVDQRRGALRGFINSPFRMDDLLKGARGQNALKIRMKIYDGTTAVPDALMYDEREISRLPADMAVDSAKAVRFQTVGMVIHGHPWTMVYAMPVDLEGRENVTPVLVTGLVISVLLSTLAFVLVDRVRLIRRSEKHYFRLANFDSLTGLPNRAMFADRLERNLLQADRDRLALALLFIDIDHFKEVNDNRGHAIGDALLQEVALRLQVCVRKVDTVARLGGDEFTVILYDLQGRDDAGKVAQNMLNKLAEPWLLQGESYVISASIGIALYPADAAKALDLLKNADQAMYQAKRQGRGQFGYFAVSTS